MYERLFSTQTTSETVGSSTLPVLGITCWESCKSARGNWIPNRVRGKDAGIAAYAKLLASHKERSARIGKCILFSSSLLSRPKKSFSLSKVTDPNRPRLMSFSKPTWSVVHHIRAWSAGIKTVTQLSDVGLVLESAQRQTATVRRFSGIEDQCDFALLDDHSVRRSLFTFPQRVCDDQR